MTSTILLIEDNEAMRCTLAEILGFEGYTVLQAENGRIGLEKLLKHKPDLVISDINMPEMNGIELLRAARGNPTVASIPFFILSAHTATSPMPPDCQPDETLIKPAKSAQLLELISKYITT